MVTKNHTNFGASVSQALAERQSSQTALASSVGRSVAYTNQTITGRKRPSPEWVDLIANTLEMNDIERKALHIAAAKDHGFKID